MFDGKAFGVEIVGVVKSHVERTVAPLLAKIDALEKQIREMPVPKDGIDGKSITLSDVAPVIAEEVAKAVGELRIPEDGKAGEDGKSIDPAEVQAMVDAAIAAIPPAEKGKDADPAETAAMIKAEVECAVAALPVPQDGKDGAAGVDGKEVDHAVVEEMVISHAERILAGWGRPQDGKSVTIDDMRPIVVEAIASIPLPKDGKDAEPIIIRYSDEYAPDEIAENVAIAVKMLAEALPIGKVKSDQSSLTLNINSVAASPRQMSKTIKTRRDEGGNLVAEVVEQEA